MSSPSPDSNRPVALRARDLHWREIDGEVVILDGRARRYLALNHSGAELWRLLAGGTTRDELIARLTGVYGINDGEAAADVDRLLEALAARALLEPRPRSADG
jgi:hypothetical protein